MFVCAILPSSSEPSSFRSVLILASAYKHSRTLIDCIAIVFASRQPFTHCRTLVAVVVALFLFFFFGLLFSFSSIGRAFSTTFYDSGAAGICYCCCRRHRCKDCRLIIANKRLTAPALNAARTPFCCHCLGRFIIKSEITNFDSRFRLECGGLPLSTSHTK